MITVSWTGHLLSAGMEVLCCVTIFVIKKMLNYSLEKKLILTESWYYDNLTVIMKIGNLKNIT